MNFILHRGPERPGQSGRGQPHSKTLARLLACHSVREVLECGCPLPLSLPDPSCPRSHSGSRRLTFKSEIRNPKSEIGRASSRRLLHLSQCFQDKMAAALCLALALVSHLRAAAAADFTPAPQKFRQEISRAFGEAEGLPRERIQLLEILADGNAQAFAGGHWFQFKDGRWQPSDALAPT